MTPTTHIHHSHATLATRPTCAGIDGRHQPESPADIGGIRNSKFDDFKNGPIFQPRPPAQGGNVTLTGDFSGNELYRAPKYMVNVGVRYEVPTPMGVYSANASYTYNDGFYWDTENRLREPSYSLINAQLSWLSPNDRYKVTLWGKNLTDEDYTLYGIASGVGDLLAPAPPRTYGVTLGVNF